MIYPLHMAIFHCNVSSPESNSLEIVHQSTKMKLKPMKPTNLYRVYSQCRLLLPGVLPIEPRTKYHG